MMASQDFAPPRIGQPPMLDTSDRARESPFDAWLRRDLAAQYDPTLAESLPDAILALLRELH